MYLYIVFCLLIARNAIPWDGYHRQLDDELPAISWRDCGISVRNCDPNSTFKDPVVSSRISGGEYANSGEYPWFAYIESTYIENDVLTSSTCGGAIINEWWVLTAGHCVRRVLSNQSTVVLIGSIARYGGRRHEVEKVVIHPKYFNSHLEEEREDREIEQLFKVLKDFERGDGSDGTLTEDKFLEIKSEYRRKRSNSLRKFSERYWTDIALLKVKNRIVPVFNQSHYNINSICLPKTSIMNEKNESLVFIGMGRTGPTQGLSDRLKKGMSVMLDRKSCRNLDRNAFSTPMVCFKHMHTSKNPLLNSSGLQGDSGSPSHQYLGCKAVQIGLVSYGYYSEEFHTRVSLFMSWIRSKILSEKNLSSNEKRMVCETNHLLIVSVITTAITGVVVCSALLWISVTILRIN